MRVAALLTLAVVLPVWTVLLLTPNPVPPAVTELLGFWDWAMFVAAKSLHAGVYAVLAALGVFGFGRRNARWVGLVLVLHGAATEVGQTFVPPRTGTRKDVCIDAAGVVVGCLAARRFLRSKP